MFFDESNNILQMRLTENMNIFAEIPMGYCNDTIQKNTFIVVKGKEMFKCFCFSELSSHFSYSSV